MPYYLTHIKGEYKEIPLPSERYVVICDMCLNRYIANYASGIYTFESSEDQIKFVTEHRKVHGKWYIHCVDARSVVDVEVVKDLL